MAQNFIIKSIGCTLYSSISPNTKVNLSVTQRKPNSGLRGGQFYWKLIYHPANQLPLPGGDGHWKLFTDGSLRFYSFDLPAGDGTFYPFLELYSVPRDFLLQTQCGTSLQGTGYITKLSTTRPLLSRNIDYNFWLGCV